MEGWGGKGRRRGGQLAATKDEEEEGGRARHQSEKQRGREGEEHLERGKLERGKVEREEGGKRYWSQGDWWEEVS
jgi:hypothetical protein